MSIYIPIHTIGSILDALKEQGALTVEHLEAALIRESDNGLGWHHLRPHRMVEDIEVARWRQDGEIDRMFDRALIVVRWILDNLDALEALPVDHAEFVRGLMRTERYPYPTFLSGPVISARIALEFARRPEVLRFLPEDERERTIAELTARFGDRIQHIN